MCNGSLGFKIDVTSGGGNGDKFGPGRPSSDFRLNVGWPQWITFTASEPGHGFSPARYDELTCQQATRSVDVVARPRTGAIEMTYFPTGSSLNVDSVLALSALPADLSVPCEDAWPQPPPPVPPPPPVAPP
eukprot:4535306-Prymnesium_polylepis.2